MAIGDRFKTNVAGDTESVIVVFEGNTDMQASGWQETLQIVRLDNGTYMAMLNHGKQLTWPTTKEEACKVMAEQLAKYL